MDCFITRSLTIAKLWLLEVILVSFTYIPSRKIRMIRILSFFYFFSPHFLILHMISRYMSLIFYFFISLFIYIEKKFFFFRLRIKSVGSVPSRRLNCLISIVNDLVRRKLHVFFFFFFSRTSGKSYWCM